MVRLCPIVYDPMNPKTNFQNLIGTPSYADALFLFNDNFKDRNSKYPGGNSAVIRPYTFHDPPQAMGISTGWSSSQGGFKILDENVKQAILLCFETVNHILYEHPHIQRVFYSCDKNDPKSLGYAIFRPSASVISHITEKLQSIPKRASQNIAISKTALSLLENRLELKKNHMKDPLESQFSTAYVNKFKSRKRVREIEN